MKTVTKQKERYIPMHKVAANLQADMCKMLPILHAVSGCDSTSAFFGREKLDGLRLLLLTRN